MSFTAKIEADIADFQKGMQQAIASSEKASKEISSKLNSLSSSFMKVGGAMSVFSTAVGATAVGLVKLATTAGDTSATLLNLSNATATSTDFLQEMGHVANNQNSSFEAFAGTVEIFQRMLKGVTETGDRTVDVLKSIGVSVTDSNGAFRQSEDVYIDALTALAGMEDGIEKTAIGTQLFSRRWKDASLLISDGADNLHNLRQEAHDMGLVLSNDALKGASDFATAMGIVNSRIQILKTRIGAELAPVLQETILPLLNDTIIPLFNKFADRISVVIKAFNDLPSSTKNAIVVLTGVATAIGPILLGLGGLLKLLPLIGAGFTALTGPVGLIVTAIAGAVVLIIKNWDSIKAYFTTGGGAELFKSIVFFAQSMKKNVTEAFQSVKAIVLPIWQSLSDFLSRYWKGTLSVIVETVANAINIVTDIINLFAGYLKWDEAQIEESFFNIFRNAFEAIERVVRQGLAMVSDLLGGLLRLVKLDKWADSVQSFADKVRPPIKEVAETISELGDSTEKSATKVATGLTVINDAVEGAFKDGNNIHDLVMRVNKELEETNTKLLQLRTGVLVVDNLKKSIEETEAKVMELTNTLGLLTGDREYNLKLKVNGKDAIDDTELLNVSPIITPTIDTSKLENAMGDLSSGISMMFIEVGAMATESITDLMGSMADAIVNGTSVLDAVGSSLLGSLGSIMVELGQMVLTAGIGIEAVKLALKTLNPVAAIVAGTALIAIGSMFSAGSRKLGSSMGSSGSSGYSSSASMAKAQPVLGSSEYRGAYNDDFKVQFEIGSNALVAVLDTAEQRRNRL